MQKCLKKVSVTLVVLLILGLIMTLIGIGLMIYGKLSHQANIIEIGAFTALGFDLVLFGVIVGVNYYSQFT